MTSIGMEKMKHDTLGVDVSKDHLDAHRLADGATRRFANDKAGHKRPSNGSRRRLSTVSCSNRPGPVNGERSTPMSNSSSCRR
jgi:hypothetical protein